MSASHRPPAPAPAPRRHAGLNRWPSALGLVAAVLLLVSGANRELVVIVVAVAALCYLGAAALSRPWVAWAGILGGGLVVFVSELVGAPWWAG
ncbi:MAG TPA: hypothetical protein VNV66_09205, partial [Pilimelia sp.]|nr:hypothetical protein [Pilimelia sp.]